MSRATEKMRRQGLATSPVIVMLYTNWHRPEDAQYYATRHVKLTIATADTGRLIRAPLWGLRGIYKPGFRYKKCGILLLDLALAEVVQGSLFLRPDDPRRVALMGCGGPAQPPLRPRQGALCQYRHRAWVETAVGISFATLYHPVD